MSETGEGEGGGAKRSSGAFWAFIPLAAFAFLGAIFAVQLYSPPSDVLDSARVARPAPDFVSAPLEDGAPEVTDALLREGKVTVLNFWASWCVPCRVEHPALMALAQDPSVQMVGLAYRDAPEDARRFLDELGDPFEHVGRDPNGAAAIRWGIEGVPETFVIAGDGRVIHRHAGPIQNDDLQTKILPAIAAAAAAAPPRGPRAAR